MKITKLESFTRQYVGFVKLTAESGAVGWGQFSPYNADITARVFHRQVAPWAIGVAVEDAATPQDIAALTDFILEREHKFPGSYMMRALAGLDTALLDLHGRLQECSVAGLLGGAPGKLRVYGSSMKRDISPRDEADRFVRLRDDLGIDAFKFRVGSECGRDRDEWPGRSEEIVPLVCKALGEGVATLVDANSCYSPPRAIELGKLLSDNGVCHFEEPCPYWEPRQTRAVRDALTLDVAGGEQDCTMQVWKSNIEGRVVDIVQPDVMYVGGVSRAMQVAAMADAAGLPCTPHCANLSLVTLCTMHMLTALPNAGNYLELSIEGADYYPWQEGLFVKNPFAVEDGTVMVPDAPGWGVEISPDWLAGAKYRATDEGRLTVPSPGPFPQPPANRGLFFFCPMLH